MGTRSEMRARRYVICLEYIGKTRLEAIGSATGRRYVFEHPGARQIVDPRDRPSLAAIPHLQQV